jgi:hypothetical protein
MVSQVEEEERQCLYHNEQERLMRRCSAHIRNADNAKTARDEKQ